MERSGYVGGSILFTNGAVTTSDDDEKTNDIEFDATTRIQSNLNKLI